MSIDTPALNIQPVCQVKDCQKGSQIMAKYGSEISYFKTCRRHTYRDLTSVKSMVTTNKQCCKFDIYCHPRAGSRKQYREFRDQKNNNKGSRQ